MKKISHLLNLFLSLEFIGVLHAYEHSSLAGKYQTGIIDFNFYYKHDDAGGGWMPKLADYYGGRNNGDAILGLRRSIVPSAMVDWNGDLYTISLYEFKSYGPGFQVNKFHCSNGMIEKDGHVYHPFWDAFDDKDPAIGYEPYFGGNTYDACFFKNGFHNVLNPCIVQEVETPSAASSIYIRIFHLIPAVRLIGSHYTSRSDFEGGFWMKFAKNNLSNRVNWRTDNRGRLNWTAPVINYGRSNVKSFANHPGHYQGFHLESSPYRSWIFHAWCGDWNIAGSDAVNLDDENCGINCIRYSSSQHYKMGEADVTAQGGAGINSTVTILPRFIKVGSYVYFGTIANGFWFFLRRITPNQADDDNVGTLEQVGAFRTDCYVETTSRAHTWAPYGWDFCILEKDGSPSTASSSGSDKILCLFCLSGGGSYSSLTSGYNWSSTYVNWTLNYAAGVITSRYFNSTGLDAVSYAYPQNTIYVTNHTRASNTYVNIKDTSKSDEYRLYLNSHKMVPYTSPSGRHYLIYAYCYPGKKTHLYLGYGQYIVDSNYNVRLLTQTEFKAAGNSGWGDSFGAFTDCTRIISMDLKNGHLWITFSKETGIDATGQSLENRQAAYHYNYFHILVTDLIKE